jgi:hypothetical protein
MLTTFKSVTVALAPDLFEQMEAQRYHLRMTRSEFVRMAIEAATRSPPPGASATRPADWLSAPRPPPPEKP